MIRMDSCNWAQKEYI